MYDQLITSKNIINLISNLVDIKSYNSILDLCSGKGIFLNECAKINPNAKFTGFEINQIINIITKMRLLISGASLTLYKDNVLQTPLYEKYDLVFSDFPWAIRTSKDVVDDENMVVEYQRNRMKADWNFIYKAINAMKENGKAIVIVHQGTLFNTPDKNARKQVVEKGLLETVIKLPAGTYPGTNIQYSILIFSYNNTTVQLIDATDCVKSANSLNKKIDVEKVMKLYASSKDKCKKIVDKDQIESTDYNLDVGRYIGDVFELNLKNPKPIKDIGVVLGGFQYTTKSLDELDPGKGNIDIVKITNINEGEIEYSSLPSASIDEKRVEKYILKDNDILISVKGTNIKLALVENLNDRKIIPHSNLMVIRITSTEVLPGYICSFLNSDTGQIILKSLQTGSVIINITKNSLLDMNIPIVDMDTQETIINRYSILKEEIIKLKQRLKVLESKVRTIYDDEVGD